MSDNLFREGTDVLVEYGEGRTLWHPLVGLAVMTWLLLIVPVVVMVWGAAF